jgi:hypothetical protein
MFEVPICLVDTHHPQRDRAGGSCNLAWHKDQTQHASAQPDLWGERQHAAGVLGWPAYDPGLGL